MKMSMLHIAGVAVAAALAVVACSDEHDGHDDLAAECQAIIDACHTKDDGTPGELHECHETAHDVGTKEACAPVQADCVALCNAAPTIEGPDAGAGYEL